MSAAEASAPAREKGFARARAGHRIYYEVGGAASGPPLVLVRGLARSSAYWLEMRALLEAERRVIVLDNRGVGRSDVPSGPLSTEEMADDVALVLRACGVERADVFGISLGGMIAQHVALRHPHRVRRLVLACTSPGGRGARAPSLRAALALARATTMPFAEGIRASAPWVLGAEAREARPEIVDVWVAIAEREPRSRAGVLAQLVAAATHDAFELLEHISHPTLVVTGDADRLVPPENSRVLAERIPNASLRTLRGAGHDFPTERPEETARILSSFLSE